MSSKEILLLIVTGLLLFGLYLTQRDRLKAYDACYMAKYEDWNTDCVLTKGGEK